MPKKTTKKKTSKRKGKKKRAPRRRWLKLLIVLIIICAGLLYLFSHYRGVSVKGMIEGYLPEVEIKENLYFGDLHSDFLVSERRTIKGSYFTTSQKISSTIKELIKGSQTGLIRTIPQNTVLKNVRIDGEGIVWLNFSGHLTQEHPGGSSAEIMTVYSIVDTVLLNYPTLKKVGILVDGVKIQTIAGHIDCSIPLVADKSYIKGVR